MDNNSHINTQNSKIKNNEINEINENLEKTKSEIKEISVLNENEKNEKNSQINFKGKSKIAEINSNEQKGNKNKSDIGSVVNETASANKDFKKNFTFDNKNSIKINDLKNETFLNVEVKEENVENVRSKIMDQFTIREDLFKNADFDYKNVDLDSQEGLEGYKRVL